MIGAVPYNPPIEYLRADASFTALEAARDELLRAEDPTGLVATQNKLAFRGRELAARWRTEHGIRTRFGDL